MSSSISMRQLSTSTLRIGIIGGGPAGLILARTLKLHGVKASITLYEREPSTGARFQGGTIDLHIKTGQLALNYAGLGERFREFARPEGLKPLISLGISITTIAGMDVGVREGHVC